jgi:hypothetical protein
VRIPNRFVHERVVVAAAATAAVRAVLVRAVVVPVAVATAATAATVAPVATPTATHAALGRGMGGRVSTTPQHIAGPRQCIAVTAVKGITDTIHVVVAQQIFRVATHVVDVGPTTPVAATFPKRIEIVVVVRQSSTSTGGRRFVVAKRIVIVMGLVPRVVAAAPTSLTRRDAQRIGPTDLLPRS